MRVRVCVCVGGEGREREREMQLLFLTGAESLSNTVAGVWSGLLQWRSDAVSSRGSVGAAGGTGVCAVTNDSLHSDSGD